jgi:hypothetical protein
MTNDDPKPFTHIIYSDFSGDDGGYNTPGSSKCLCVAWVLTKVEDIPYNENIVFQMKDLIHCKHINELKYKGIVNHPQKMALLSLVSKLKAVVIINPVIKAKISDETIKSPKTKKLLKIIHGVPLRRFTEYLSAVSPDCCYQLVIDEMSWSNYQNDILNHLKADIPDLNWKTAREDWLYFGNSKHSLLLQLADIIAGMGREYIEDLQSKTFPPCRPCYFMKWSNCPVRRKGNKIGRNDLLKPLKPVLLRNSAGQFFPGGFVVRPPEIEIDYRFVECL